MHEQGTGRTIPKGGWSKLGCMLESHGTLETDSGVSHSEMLV